MHSSQGTWNIFQHRLHIGPQGHFGKFKNIEIMQSIFFDYDRMKLEINGRRKTGKSTNT